MHVNTVSATVSIINIWNSLPANTDFTNLSSFKRSLAVFNFATFVIVLVKFYWITIFILSTLSQIALFLLYFVYFYSAA